MANDLNLCQFIGRLGADPVIRYTQSNVAIASFSIAVSKSWKNEQGEKKEKTEWVNFVAYRGIAQVIGDYLKKGSKVYVAGSFQTRKYQGQDGVERYTTEIIVKDLQMLDSRPQGQEQGQGYQSHAGSNQPNPAYAQGTNTQQPNPRDHHPQQGQPFVPDDDFDPDIPF